VKWLLTGVLLIAVSGFVLYFKIFAPPEVVWSSEIRDGNRLISEIENFRRKRGQLPSELSEISNPVEHEKLFYRRCSETSYIVWFGTTLGESVTFNSKSRDWKEVGNDCL